MSVGIIILAHGSREPETEKTMEEIVNKVRDKTSNGSIRMAYFQFVKPSLEDSVREFIEEGVKEINIIPYFLFPGVHIREDVPLALGEIKREYPGVTINVADTLGADDRLAEIVADRITALSAADG